MNESTQTLSLSLNDIRHRRGGNVVTDTDTCSGTGSCLSSFVCSEVAGMVNLPVAILRRSLPHGDHLDKAQQKESIALTITTSPPHGSLSVVDLRLSGHIIVLKTPHKGPRKAEVSFLAEERGRHDIRVHMASGIETRMLWRVRNERKMLR